MVGEVSPLIAVTGCGVVCAAGGSCSEAMDSIASWTVSTSMKGEPFFSPPAAPCFVAPKKLPVLSSSFSIADSALAGVNRSILLALSAINESLEQAGIRSDDLRHKRVGVVLGTTVGCTFHNEPYYIDWKEGREPDEKPLRTYLSANLAERVQRILGIRGPRAVITNACASGTDAIGLAGNWLRRGLCDIAIAGGTDELSRIACHGFKSLMLVSPENCRPFDRDRRGLNLGEGAGIVILERDDQLVAEKRACLGWIRGYGIAGDAHHPTAPHPDGRGLQMAVRMALADGRVTVDDISMINAHGTGTPANDRAETRAVFELGFNIAELPVVSTKGVTGHTLGAAGAIEAIFTLLALNRGKVAGTAGCRNCDPDFPFAVLPEGVTSALRGRTGMSQSLAFGGSNSVLILEGAG
ncbi:beta-ketoacyl-[acyl-carrier-protein] synthase family protein [Desulfomarina sp.]